MGRKHPNVLKLQRQSRQGRRAYLTSKYSLISVPRTIGVSGVPESLIPLFRRTYSSWTEDDAFLNAIFPGVKTPDSMWSSEGLTKYTDKDGNPIAENVGEKNGRKFCLSRADEEKLLDLVEDQEVCDFFTLPVGRLMGFRLSLVYNRQKTRLYFIEVHFREEGGYAKKSKVYSDQTRAMFDFEHHRISWMEFLPLESLSVVLPRRNG